MASSKDILQTSRPLSHRSPPCSYNTLHGSSVLRMPHSRTSSHTLSTSRPLTHEHRVRRKSIVNNNGANVAALAAAASRVDLDKVPALPMAIEKHRLDLAGLSNIPLHAASVPVGDLGLRGGAPKDDDVDDQEDLLPEGDPALQQARDRRASDSQNQGRRFNRPIIRCPHPGCEKAYKHSSCLEKHKWEHTPAWAVTSRLLISKHQQVQILEAAKSLVGMTAPQSGGDPESAVEEPSSPSLSGGFSEQMDGQSSARTTPPPDTNSELRMDLDDEMMFSAASDDEDGARGELSRQFRHSTAHKMTGFGRYMEPSPTPGPYSGEAEGDAELSRAVAMLSCSYTSSGLPGQLPGDLPPVPQVPAHYLLDQASLGRSGFLNSFTSQAPESFTRGQALAPGHGSLSYIRGQALASGSLTRGAPGFGRSNSRDVDSRMDDDDDDSRSRARSDEEEDGFFGSMDE